MKFNNGTELINHLIENEKTEDTVFIIGGGPSVSKYLPDPRVLDDHDVICTNNAYKLFPDAMLLHYADRVWWTWHTQSKHDVENAFKGNISSASQPEQPYR